METVTSASRNDWKLAASSRKMTHDGQPQPDGQPAEHFAHRRNLPADLDLDAAAAVRPRGRSAAATCRETEPRSVPAMFAVMLTWRFML